MDGELRELIERARHHTMTPDELDAQRISFAYGNAPGTDTNTKETVRDAINGSLLVEKRT